MPERTLDVESTWVVNLVTRSLLANVYETFCREWMQLTVD